MSWFESTLGGLGGLGSVLQAGNVLAAFFDAITNGRMWRSLGWLLLGGVMMALGLTLWLKAEVL